jgi:zinc/manganese transport system substrate-binding protein
MGSPPHLAASLAAITVAAALLCAGCGELPAAATVRGVRVVAAENVWGSIARQIGGSAVSVTEIIASPAQDPHSYEPTASDARLMATAQLAIVNGVGYDAWAPRLLASDPADGRTVLNAGTLLGLHPGDNPHRWYAPADVQAMAQAIAARLSRIDPRHTSYFAGRLRNFETVGLAGYDRVMTAIRRRFAGVAVGASESIFALQAPALGLRLLTPPSFLRAISEGGDLTAHDTAVAEAQITHHAIRVWVVNTQNLTPEIQRLSSLARAARIPITTITETLSPATASFQSWQTAQLERLRAALALGTQR